ncbi:MAG: transglycosylase SLT domain-containing protein, partial [Acidobacteria bacterium]|nr:transglycosylase SLT domain-containing protein [Acidobacteriota bacterium]
MILRRLVLIPALVLIWPVPSFAQTLTTAQLQQIGQQYAAQYGVPWSIFEAQIQAESSWNPNVGCNSHGACGIAQFLPSTAAQFNLDPNDPVASLQAAAQYDAQLHQQDGSWVAALTAYSGGLTPANPADYGPVFAAAETADGGTATAGGGGLTISTSDTGTIASAAAAAGVTAGSVSGSAFNPFSYLWSNYDNAIAGPLASELAAVQAMIQAPLLAILSLSVMVMAIGAYSGRIVVVDFFNRLLRIAAVVGFCGVGSQLYGLYVVQLFGSLPVWFSSHILGATSANPAAGFDAVIHLFNEAALTVWWGLPWSASTLFMDAPILGLAYFVVFVAV